VTAFRNLSDGWSHASKENTHPATTTMSSVRPTGTSSPFRPAPFFDHGLFLLHLNRGKEELRKAQYDQAGEFEAKHSARRGPLNLSITPSTSKYPTGSDRASLPRTVPLSSPQPHLQVARGPGAQPLGRVLALGSASKAHLTSASSAGGDHDRALRLRMARAGAQDGAEETTPWREWRRRQRYRFPGRAAPPRVAREAEPRALPGRARPGPATGSGPSRAPFEAHRVVAALPCRPSGPSIPAQGFLGRDGRPPRGGRHRGADGSPVLGPDTRLDAPPGDYKVGRRHAPPRRSGAVPTFALFRAVPLTPSRLSPSRNATYREDPASSSGSGSARCKLLAQAPFSRSSDPARFDVRESASRWRPGPSWPMAAS
jgi:hypothetical protein